MTESDNVQIQATRTAEYASAAVEGGTSGEDIIDKYVMLIGVYGDATVKCKGIFQVRAPGIPIKRSL